MITVTVAYDEPRHRDRRKERLLLHVGDKKFHMTRSEARLLRNKLNRFNLS